jgi:hypothetical protein
MASPSAGMHFMTRAPPMARPTCSTPSDICAAQSPGGTDARAEATCRRGMCVPGGQVPLRTLVQVFDQRLYRFQIDLPDLNPHTACSTRVEPPRSSAPECTYAGGGCAISDRGVWLGWRCTRSARFRHACCLPRSRRAAECGGRPDTARRPVCCTRNDRPPPYGQMSHVCPDGACSASPDQFSTRGGHVPGSPRSPLAWAGPWSPPHRCSRSARCRSDRSRREADAIARHGQLRVQRENVVDRHREVVVAEHCEVGCPTGL